MFYQNVTLLYWPCTGNSDPTGLVHQADDQLFPEAWCLYTLMELTQYLSRLTSLSATGPDQRKALENLQRAVLEATDTSSKQARWQASQDQLHLNGENRLVFGTCLNLYLMPPFTAATAVLEFVARVAYRFQLIDTLDFPTLAAALKLLQGLLLLHRPSAALFSRPSTLEVR